MSQPFVIGIDGGGTSSRGSAWSLDGACLVEARAGSLNANTTSNTHFTQSLCQLFEALCAGRSRDACVATVVGTATLFDEPSERQAGEWLNGLGDWRALKPRFVGDAITAVVGASAAQGGLLVIAGTGSIAVRDSGAGEFAFSGGLGPLVGGDPGSAFWLGSEALRRAQRGQLKTGRLDALGEALCDGFGVESLSALACQLHADESGATRLAAVAGRIAAQHAASPVSHWAELERAAGYALADLVLPLWPAASEVRWPVFFSGSVLEKNETVRESLRRALSERGGAEVTLERPREDAVAGACRLALARATGGGTVPVSQRIAGKVY